MFKLFDYYFIKKNLFTKLLYNFIIVNFKNIIRHLFHSLENSQLSNIIFTLLGLWLVVYIKYIYIYIYIYMYTNC